MSGKLDILLNKALRCRNRTIGYFDSEGIFCRCSARAAYLKKLYGIYSYPNGEIGFKKWYMDKRILPDVEPYFIQRAIMRLKVGDTIDNFLDYVEDEIKIHENKWEKGSTSKSLDNFITKINRPIFVREPENLRPNTFDYIYVDVCIRYYWDGSKRQYVQENFEEIRKLVVKYLANQKKFKRYGIPMNFLHISEVILTKDDILHFVFELKKI